MKTTTYQNTGRVLGMMSLVSALSWATGLGAIAQSRTRTANLEAGTVIPVRLNDKLTSNESQKGDTFTATVRADDKGDYADYLALPVGTKVEGVVRMARAKQDKDPGVLDLEFRRLRLPDGRSYSITGSLIGLDEKMVTKTKDGRLVAKPGHKNDRLTYVGYGAGAGLIVGLLTKHTLEDTVIGAGLGYLFGSLQKGNSDARDVTLKQGTEMGLRLDRSLNYASSEDRSNQGNRNDYKYQDDNRYHRTPRVSSGDQGSNQDRSGNRNVDSRVDNSDNATDIGVLLDDQNIAFASTARPVMTKGTVLVPLGPVMSAAKISYKYDEGRKQIRVAGVDGTVRLGLNSRIAVVNGNQRVSMDVPAQRLNGTIYVPLKFLKLATGGDVSWDADSRTVVITTK